MSVSRRDVLLSIPATAALSGWASAQPTGAQPGAPPQGGTPPKDPLLATCLLIGGRKQIENCTFALTKLESDEAKQFAKAEIEEHETVKKKLKGLGYAYPVTRAPGNPGNPGNGPVLWMVTAGPARLPAEAAAQVALDHEVAEQCIVNYRKNMTEYAGREFDKRFVGHQLDEHLALLDKVQVFRRHASPGMEKHLAEGQQTIEAHITTLKKLMKELDKRGD